MGLLDTERRELAGITASRRVREAIAAYGLLAPAFIVFGWFSFWPLIRLFHYATYQQNNTGTKERSVGFHQITDTLTGRDFGYGLLHNALFLLYTVPLGVVLGILLAVSAHRRLRGIKIFQTIFSSTVASSVAVSAVVFLTLINPEVGYFRGVGWLSLSHSPSALFGVSLSSIWQNLGLTFVISLAGLQAVPDELIEAATLDGYGPLRRFFRITVPLISPTLLFLAVVLTVNAMQAFAQMDILTQGGPAHSTETILFKIVNLGKPGDLGTGAAMSLGLFVLTALIAAAQFGVLNRRVHYGE